jgi:hypothetical protein
MVDGHKIKSGCLFTCFFLFLFFMTQGIDGQVNKTAGNPPIYIAFLWHMHQPIYWPYESIVQTQLNSRYSYSVYDIFNQRIGPYTSWPAGAVSKGLSLPHFGAQVSFSGSLVENLNNLEPVDGNFINWKSSWNSIRTQTTSLGNPRLDMVGFGYFHPLMGLIDYLDIRKQIQMHKQILSANFTGNYSKGIFPPENAFTNRMIPALVDEGLQWVLVDNVHFDRSCSGYPFSTSGNLYEPNKADQLNPNPNDWISLTNLWAPTQNSARWGRQPHYAQYTDPNTGQTTKMIVVPADRYLGNEDGRGGFGALQYESVMSQLESYNTDPQHPILIVLAHDGDNYGGGSDGYYNSNFQNFVNWLQANPTRFVCSTIQDYLQMFPPAENDIINVEDGSWSGADNGDPEFKKWNGDPGSDGYSPDRNSWGVITAVKNIVLTADQINSNAQGTKDGWKYLLCSEASDYWYWDGSQGGIWDSHPTRGGNLAIQNALPVANSGTDMTGPTIYAPQREPYNPGGTEWGIQQPGDFKVWSYVFDLHGLKSVKLKYRTSVDGNMSAQSYTYTGGSNVTTWLEATMTGTYIQPQTNPAPLYKAKEYSANIIGFNNKLVDYYIEATDSSNNVSKSPIKHVWVGNSSGSTTGSTVFWTPAQPSVNDSITIYVVSSQGAYLHWGVNYSGSTWQAPNNVYWPAGTTLYSGGAAVESPFAGPVNDTIKIKIGPFNKSAQSVSKIAFVIHYNDNTWNNNSGNDFHIDLSGSSIVIPFVMDGNVDTSAVKISTNNGMDLYAGWNGSDLYVATQSAPSVGNDVFIFITDSLRPLTAAPWAKSGQVVNWVAFLANESANNYNAWTSVTGSSQHYSGNFLEGTLNLQSQFGYIPSKIYICAARYQTNDGGSLIKQVPIGNGDGNLDASEFYLYMGSASPMVLTLTALLEARYNGSTMVPDTVTVELHNAFYPYTLVESQKGVLNTAGVGTFYFTTAVIDTPYYIVVKQRNSLETWSATPQTFRVSQ